jgi:hypothetical protein
MSASEKPNVTITLTCSPSFTRYLKRLGQSLAAEGKTFDPANALAVVDYALFECGVARGLNVPRRAPRPGGARVGAGRKPKSAG